MDTSNISRSQAKQLVADINASTSNLVLRRLIYEFYTRKCFLVLGFDKMRDCIESRLQVSLSKFYRTLAAAEVEANINPHGTIGEVCEFTLRELGKLNSHQQRIVWQRATQQTGLSRRFPTAKLVRTFANECLGKSEQKAEPKSDRQQATVANDDDDDMFLGWR